MSDLLNMRARGFSTTPQASSLFTLAGATSQASALPAWTGFNGAPQPAPASPYSGEFAPVLSSIAQDYPLVGNALAGMNVVSATSSEPDYQSEFYQPTQHDNPHPGKPTIEVYKKDPDPKYQKNLIAGDAMHYLGSGEEGSDPVIVSLKNELLSSRDEDQTREDHQAYERQPKDVGFGPNNGHSFDEFMRYSRGDEIIMGYLFPDRQNDWTDYTDQQKAILEKMRTRLRGQ